MSNRLWRVVAALQVLIGVAGFGLAAVDVVDGYWLGLGAGWVLLGAYTWKENVTE